jgi:hypothetical protein
MSGRITEAGVTQPNSGSTDGSGKAEELRRLATCALPLPQWFQDAQERDFAPKIALVDPSSEDCFVHRLEFAECELPWKKLKTDRGIFQFVSQPFESIAKNMFVIKGQGREVVPLREESAHLQNYLRCG